MRTGAMAFLLLVGASITASAQDSRRMVFGVGVSNSCGKWTIARRSKPADAYIFQQWIAGYLSGMNRDLVRDTLGGTDHDGIMAWVDNYCMSNPLERIINAADALMDELKLRAPPK